MKICRSLRVDEAGGLFRRARAGFDTTPIVLYFYSFPFLGTSIWRELSENLMPLCRSSDIQVDLSTSNTSCHICVLIVLPPAKSASASWRYNIRLTTFLGVNGSIFALKRR